MTEDETKTSGAGAGGEDRPRREWTEDDVEAELKRFRMEYELRRRHAEEVGRTIRTIEGLPTPSADALPGPRVHVTLRKDDDPPELLARFDVWYGERLGYFWPQWLLSGTINLIGGSLGIGSLSIDPFPHASSEESGSVTAKVLRDIPLTQIFEKVKAKLREAPDLHVLDVQLFPGGNPLTGEPWGKQKKLAYQRAVAVAAKGLDKYAEAARLYGRLRMEGAASIYPEMARRAGISKRRARSLIEAARTKDYLRPAGERGGRKALRPTMRLKLWIEQHTQPGDAAVLKWIDKHLVPEQGPEEEGAR